MSKPEINNKKIVVFTGAGISAESGIKTFRDHGGLWENYPIELVASIEGWRHDPALVLEFYNMRRKDAASAQPNAAHFAIAKLEEKFEVVVVTQNVDSLHEKAGSTNVIHLHGELSKARSSVDENLIHEIGDNDINMGDTCELGGQLRPHIVWFGEIPLNMDVARTHFKDASYVLAVGSSLVVEPAASLLKQARYQAEKVLVSLDVERVPYGYKYLRGKATSLVPYICNDWLN